MENSGRKEAVLKNVTSQMGASTIQSLLGFVARRVFLMYLGENLLGLNGVMTSIIGMLSLAELGFGEAINYSLYEPLAHGDKEQVASIMALYRKLYIGIAAVIAALGLALIPLLHLFVETSVPITTVYLAFGLYLLDTCLSYCLAYNRNIITADQKDYIVIRISMLFQIITQVLQLALIIITKNYFVYLIAKSIVTVIQNVYIYSRANKMYPYINNRKPAKLPKTYTKTLMHNVKALFVTRVSYFCVSGTDNLLLSSFVSLISVAVYNNYVTIFNLFNKTFNTVFDKARAIIGNYIVVNGDENAYPLFKRIFFVNFLITSFTSTGIFVVCNEVINVWLGTGHTGSLLLVGLLVFNNYSRFILQTCEAFRGARGLYCPRPFVKYISLLEGIINLIVSLLFIFLLEDRIVGVFLGTSVSTLVSTIAVPWIVYKFLFRRPLRQFYAIYFKYLLVWGITMAVSCVVFHLLLTPSHIINVIIGIVVCTAITAAIYLAVFRKTDEFKYSFNIVKGLLARIKK